MNNDVDIFLKNITLSLEEKNKGLIDIFDIEYNLGEAYYNAQEYEKAIKYYKSCLNILNDNFDINDDQELNIKDKKIRNKIALSYANLGDGYYNEQDIESAINLFKHSINFSPNDYLLFHKLGICFDQLDNNSDSAINYLNKSLRLNDDFYKKYIEIEKNNPNFYNRLGHIYYLQQTFLEKSFEYFKIADKLNPGNFNTLTNLLLKDINLSPEEKNKGLIDLIDMEYNLGETYYDAQEYEKAVENYNVCLNILYDNFDINDDQELNIKDKVEEIKNKIALSYANLGDEHYNKQDIESTINFYKQGLIFNPDHYLLFHKLGIYFNQLDNNSDSAIFYLNKSLKLNDNYAETYRVLGDNTYFNREEYIESINNFEKYIEIEKNNSSVYNRLGHIYKNSRFF